MASGEVLAAYQARFSLLPGAGALAHATAELLSLALITSVSCSRIHSAAHLIEYDDGMHQLAQQ
jgi:hypothetical protein